MRRSGDRYKKAQQSDEGAGWMLVIAQNSTGNAHWVFEDYWFNSIKQFFALCPATYLPSESSDLWVRLVEDTMLFVKLQCTVCRYC